MQDIQGQISHMDEVNYETTTIIQFGPQGDR